MNNDIRVRETKRKREGRREGYGKDKTLTMTAKYVMSLFAQKYH